MFFTKKTQYALRATVLALMAVTVIMLILAATTDFGTYIFEIGSSKGASYIKPGTPAVGTAGQPGYVAATAATFIKRNPTIGLLWGNESILKWALAFSLVGGIATLAQMVKQFGKNAVSDNFANSIVIVISLLIVVGLGSTTWAVIPAGLALLVQIPVLVHSILVKFKGASPLVVKEVRMPKTVEVK